MIVDLATLRLHLKVDDTVTVDDPLIVAMEAAAREYLQEETGRYFGDADVLTDVRDSFGRGPIYLRAVPLTGGVYDLPSPGGGPFPLPDPVVERRDDPSGDWALVDPSFYEFDGARLYPLADWAPAKRSVRVTYIGGYDVSSTTEPTAPPANVQQAVRELVTRMYKYRMPTADGPVLAALPASVHDVIRAYKVPVF